MQIVVGRFPRLAARQVWARSSDLVGDYTVGDWASGEGIHRPAMAAQRVSETGGEGER